MTCKMCVERGTTWEGSDPKCAFEGNEFSGENWNCATMNALRDICEEKGSVVWTEDQNACVLAVPDACEHVVLSWYKSRGRTESAFILHSSFKTPTPLTLEIAEKILAR